jgi:localization factor PodJL
MEAGANAFMSYAPWTVKGVDPEAREAAKLAARRAGVPLGAWLGQTIRAAATAQFKGQTGPVYQAPSPGNPTGNGSPEYGAYSGSGGGRPPSLTMEALLESFNRLAQRLEQTEGRTSEALAPLAQKVTELSEKIEKSSTDKGVASEPLERAMMRITERLDRIETGRPSGSPSADRGTGRRPRGFFARLFSD